MSFIRTVIIRTNPLGQLRGREQPVGFNDGTLAMYPFGFDGIEPGTLLGQKQGQDTHAVARCFHLLIVLANPGPNDLAFVPGGIVPDQQPRGFALPFQFRATPGQKLGGDLAHRASIDKAQAHLIADGSLGCSSLPQHSITGQRFRIGIGLLPRLFHQANGVIAHLPGMGVWQSKATPPHLVEKANRPGGGLLLLRGPTQQSVASRFFLGPHCLLVYSVNVSLGSGGGRRGTIVD